jgi:hypothetical protein
LRPLVTLALSLILFTLSGALPFPAHAQQEGYEIWQDGEFGIILTYPDTWYVDERPETIMVPCIIEVSYDGLAEKDPFGAFVMPVYIGEGYFERVSELAEAWKGTVRDDWRDDGLEFIDAEEKVLKFIDAGGDTFETHQGYAVSEMRYRITDESGSPVTWLVWLVLTETKKKAWVIGYCAKVDFKKFYSQAHDIIATAEFSD